MFTILSSHISNSIPFFISEFKFILFGCISTQNYQTIWSLICWSEEDEFGGKDPELFWEFDDGGPTLLGFVAEFTDAPVNDWKKNNYKENKYLYWI